MDPNKRKRPLGTIGSSPEQKRLRVQELQRGIEGPSARPPVTPIPRAPQAPSMTARTPSHNAKSSAPAQRGNVGLPFDATREFREKLERRSKAPGSTQAPVTSSLEARLKKLESQQDGTQKFLAELRQRFDEDVAGYMQFGKEANTNMQVTSMRLDKLEKSLSEFRAKSDGAQTLLTVTQNDVRALKDDMRTLKDKTATILASNQKHAQQVDKLSAQFEGINDRAVATQNGQVNGASVEEMSARLSSMIMELNEVTARAFDEKLQALSKHLDAVSEVVSALQGAEGHLTSKEAQYTKDVAGFNEGLRDVKGQMAALETKVAKDVEALNEAIQGFEGRMVGAEDNVAALLQIPAHFDELMQTQKKEVDGVLTEVTQIKDTLAQQNLQVLVGRVSAVEATIVSLDDRYNALNTEVLFNQITHWIDKNYPQAQQFLGKLTAMEQALNQHTAQQRTANMAAAERTAQLGEELGAMKQMVAKVQFHLKELNEAIGEPLKFLEFDASTQQDGGNK